MEHPLPDFPPPVSEGFEAMDRAQRRTSAMSEHLQSAPSTGGLEESAPPGSACEGEVPETSPGVLVDTR